tara:strand:+ start:878 stop:1537 length:660 start_codon:yes stop_codon:yes gene_type:complete
MARVIRLNSAGGGSSASSGSGITLDDVENAYDVPKLLQTIDTGNSNDISITDLDTAAYERFYILMSNFCCTNDSYINFGGMNGSTKWNSENRWVWGGYQTNGSNRMTSNGGSMVRSNAGSSHTQGATAGTDHQTMIEWNFFFPDPSGSVYEITGNMNYMNGQYSYGNNNCWGNFTFEKNGTATHGDGLNFYMQTGSFQEIGNPFRTTVYGYKRRPASAG